MPPQHGKPLLLYLSIIGDVVGSMLAKEDDDKDERAIYYLSKRFHDYETRYTPIEKSCFALVCAIQRLRHHLTFPNMGGSKNGPIEVSF